MGACTWVCRAPRGAPESVSEAHFLEGLLHGLPVLVVGMGGPGVGMVPTVCPSHFHPNRFFTQNALFCLRTCPFPPVCELGSHISLQMRRLTHPPRKHVPRAGGAGAGAAPAFLPVSPARLRPGLCHLHLTPQNLGSVGWLHPLSQESGPGSLCSSDGCGPRPRAPREPHFPPREFPSHRF